MLYLNYLIMSYDTGYDDRVINKGALILWYTLVVGDVKIGK